MLAIATGQTAWLPLLAWIGTMSGIGLFAGMAVLAAVFPTGALPAGRIGRITRFALALIGAIALLQAVDPAFATTLADGSVFVVHNPIGIAPEWSGWALFDDGQVYVFVLLGIVICVVGLVIRFRRSSGIERQQDRWLLASLALVAVAVFIGFPGHVPRRSGNRLDLDPGGRSHSRCPRSPSGSRSCATASTRLTG